jgi:hypothetical protein
MNGKCLELDEIVINQNEVFRGNQHTIEVMNELQGQFTIIELAVLKMPKLGRLCPSVTGRLFDKIERILRRGYWSIMYLGCFMKIYCSRDDFLNALYYALLSKDNKTLCKALKTEMKYSIANKYFTFIQDAQGPADILEKMKELPAYMKGVHPVQIGFLFFTVGITFTDGARRSYREKRKKQ